MHLKSFRHLVFLLWHMLTLFLFQRKFFSYTINFHLIIKILTFCLFDCWELSSSTTPSSSSVLHLGKLIRKPRCSFLWGPEVQTRGAPAHMWEPTSQPTPTSQKKCKPVNFLYPPKPFLSPAWGLPCSSKKGSCEW